MLNVKKYLPFILLGVGLIIVVLAFVLIRSKKSGGETEVEEEMVAEIPVEKRPVASLMPSGDGHWLTLTIDNIKVEAVTLDYELLYKLPDGRTQGVPGTVTLNGQNNFERKLLLGSESSGKFRYDEGVETGTLTLRFRNDKGKMVGKLTTEFHLQSATDTLASTDNKFKLVLSKVPKTGFFVTMGTFGLPKQIDNIDAGPYGVFSDTFDYSGVVTLGSGAVSLYSTESWIKLSAGKTSSLGIFLSTNE